MRGFLIHDTIDGARQAAIFLPFHAVTRIDVTTDPLKFYVHTADMVYTVKLRVRETYRIGTPSEELDSFRSMCNTCDTVFVDSVSIRMV